MSLARGAAAARGSALLLLRPRFPNARDSASRESCAHCGRSPSPRPRRAPTPTRPPRRAPTPARPPRRGRARAALASTSAGRPRPVGRGRGRALRLGASARCCASSTRAPARRRRSSRHTRGCSGSSSASARPPFSATPLGVALGAQLVANCAVLRVVLADDAGERRRASRERNFCSARVSRAGPPVGGAAACAPPALFVKTRVFSAILRDG